MISVIFLMYREWLSDTFLQGEAGLALKYIILRVFYENNVIKLKTETDLICQICSTGLRTATCINLVLLYMNDAVVFVQLFTETFRFLSFF